MRSLKVKFAIGFLSGVAVIAAGFFFLKSTQKTQKDLLYERAAANEHVPVAVFRRIMDVEDHVEKSHKFTDDDWEVVKADVASDNLELRQDAIACCMSLRFSDPHRDEAVKFAKDYLALNQKYGNIPAVITLHKLRDPSWKEQALRVQQSSDPVTRSEMTQVLARINEKKK